MKTLIPLILTCVAIGFFILNPLTSGLLESLGINRHWILISMLFGATLTAWLHREKC